MAARLRCSVRYSAVQCRLDALTVHYSVGATAAADTATATACKGRSSRSTNTAEKTGNPGKGTGTGARLQSRTGQDRTRSLVYAVCGRGVRGPHCFECSRGRG
jgi:hypothetical protein